MEQTELDEHGPTQPDIPDTDSTPAFGGRPSLSPQTTANMVDEPGYSDQVPTEADTAGYVYALGRIEPRFPSMAVEKEFAQATGRAETSGLTDREALHAVLTQRENRYLVRLLCWVLTIEGLDTYILHPRDPMELDLLVDALRSNPRPTDIDVVIGTRGPIAPPNLCNGLMVPILAFSQVYSFDIDSLIKSIPRPKGVPAKEFTSACEEVFSRTMQMADNSGAVDDHRALNYLAIRYPAVYATAAEMFRRDASLSSVYVQPSPLAGVQRIVEVIFCFTDRNTDVVEKFFVRVDVTGEFPFLVTKMSPYFDR